MAIDPISLGIAGAANLASGILEREENARLMKIKEERDAELNRLEKQRLALQLLADRSQEGYNAMRQGFAQSLQMPRF